MVKEIIKNNKKYIFKIKDYSKHGVDGFDVILYKPILRFFKIPIYKKMFSHTLWEDECFKAIHSTIYKYESYKKKEEKLNRYCQ